MLFDTDLITYRGLYKTIQTDKLNVPAIDGRRTILSNHMPVMVALDDGVIETNNEGVLSHFAVSEGILYFENNKATIICDVIEDLKDVDVKYYEKRMNDAKDSLATSRNDDDIRRAKIKLARATNVIKAASKVKN